jgi:hypothetical protein
MNDIPFQICHRLFAAHTTTTAAANATTVATRVAAVVSDTTATSIANAANAANDTKAANAANAANDTKAVTATNAANDAKVATATTAPTATAAITERSCVYVSTLDNPLCAWTLSTEDRGSPRSILATLQRHQF